MNDRDKERAERRKKVVGLGEAGVPVTEICKRAATPRKTVISWLNDAGIEPVMLRQRRTISGSGNTLPAGKALSIEEGVRKRLEALEGAEDA